MRTEDQFWGSIDRSGGRAACWPWLRGKHNRAGYGALSWRGTIMLAHRVAYMLATGHSASGHVCHTCDNPPCCNPAHLYDGDATTNSRDRQERGRNRGFDGMVGEGHPRATLNAAKVRQIRELKSTTALSSRQIGEIVGCSGPQVLQVWHRKTWAHVD